MTTKLFLVPVFLVLCQFAIAQSPVANFTASPLSGCAPLVVTFQDQSSGNPKFWNWDFGNGQLSSLQNPTAVFTQPGVYAVTLVVRNVNGTNGITKTNYITVNASPSANFTTNIRTACAPANIQFTDLSVDATGSISKWEWDFGDGTTSGVQNPQKTFSATGFYTIRLKVTSSTGCTGSIIATRYIRMVSGVNVSFDDSLNAVCIPPFTANFTNQTSGPGILSYLWDFGNATTSTQKDPTATYATSGSYIVKLVARSDFGCADSIQKSVLIRSTNTNFTSADTTCLNKSVTFQNTSNPSPISSFWSFGDGTTSTQPNPSKIFTTPGLHQVKLVNTYSFCTDSVTKTIHVLPPPAINFAGVNIVACKPPLTVSFQDISPNAVSWSWNLGNGFTSTQQNPVSTYTVGGEFDVSMTITTTFGCTNTITKTNFVRILKPIAGISNVPAGGCIPFTFSPTHHISAVDGVASWFWDFGDGGATSTLQNPSHTYTNAGNYPIKLKITTTGGCTDSITVVNGVRTGTPPVVDFSSANTSVCASDTVRFTDLSNPSDEWLWNFGDGTSSIQKNPTHVFADTGKFTISLTAYNNRCGVSISKPQYITTLPPISRFSDTVLDCNNKYTVTFSDKSITNPANGPISYFWEFGDPGNNTSTLANPTFTYPSLGTYNVKLTVTNGSCSHSIVNPVKLVSELADFTATKTTICKNEKITISATGGDPSNIVQYQWSIGGGPLFTAPRSFDTSFAANGTYDIRLTITDISGCTDTKSVNSFITVTGPLADFITSIPGTCQNKTITFTDQSTTSGTIVKWTWDFGDSVTQTFTTPPFTHQYSDTGIFTVRLTVEDNIGCTDVVTKPNFITIAKPKADFSAEYTLFCQGGSLQFSDSSQGSTMTYLWDFGDGATSTQQNPAHVYSGADGAYTVKLKVQDAFGCEDSITKPNYIEVKSPKPSFTVTDTTSICPPFETKFTFTGKDYESFYWDFGDSITSTLMNPRHFYNGYGTFTAKLYLVGYGGCLDSAMHAVNIYDPSSTVISYNPLSSCNEISVDFSVTTVPSTKFNFYFGDGKADSSQIKTFQHFYDSPNLYYPYLILTDSTNCQVTIPGTEVIRVLGAIPLFSADRKAFCDTGFVYFTNYTLANDPIVSRVWDFGDGITTTDKDAIHFYNQPGLYLASLAVTTQSGCSKQIIDTVRVYRTPEPLINSADTICINSPVLFQGNLIQADTAITWRWNFGNGQTSDLQNGITIFNKEGNYTISLDANNKLGCGNSLSKNVYVAPLPVINILAEPIIPVGTGIVLPVSYSQNASTYSWSPSNTLNCSDCPRPYANPKFTTKYTVTVTDSIGCSSSQDINVIVVCTDKNYYIPNTFSPNGDGVNDVFYPRGTGIERIQSLRIFNRWGELVFEKRNFMANSISEGWNGTYRGKPANADTYVYVIEYICENATVIPYRGNVTLIR